MTSRLGECLNGHGFSLQCFSRGISTSKPATTPSTSSTPSAITSTTTSSAPRPTSIRECALKRPNLSRCWTGRVQSRKENGKKRQSRTYPSTINPSSPPTHHFFRIMWSPYSSENWVEQSLRRFFLQGQDFCAGGIIRFPCQVSWRLLMSLCCKRIWPRTQLLIFHLIFLLIYASFCI